MIHSYRTKGNGWNDTTRGKGIGQEEKVGMMLQKCIVQEEKVGMMLQECIGQEERVGMMLQECIGQEEKVGMILQEYRTRGKGWNDPTRV